jgi:Domain of unknown function (DUF4189)
MNRMSGTLRALALAVTVMIVAVGTSARAQTSWVAFATHANGAFGIAWGAPTSDAAAAAAIAQCGFEKCQLGRVFGSRCIAVAGSHQSSARGFGAGNGEEAAMRSAYEWCEKSNSNGTCHIEIVRCAP